MSEKDKNKMFPANGSAKDFMQVFKRGVQFTEELLQENERLRIRLVRLQEENKLVAKKTVSPETYGDLLDQMKVLEEERMSMLSRFREVEEESHDFKSRYKEIEEENDRLANLYIASYQLHSTLDLKEVIRITFEIIINLVGSMDFVLHIVDNSKLVPVKAQGKPLATFPLIEIGEGLIGKSAEQRSLYAESETFGGENNSEPIVCVPLVVENELLGMISMFSFLSHKKELTQLDKELFKLLGGHAATAMFSSRLKAGTKDIVHDAASYIRLLNS